MSIPEYLKSHWVMMRSVSFTPHSMIKPVVESMGMGFELYDVKKFTPAELREKIDRSNPDNVAVIDSWEDADDEMKQAILDLAVFYDGNASFIIVHYHPLD